MMPYDYSQLPNQQSIDRTNQYPIMTSFPTQQIPYNPMIMQTPHTDINI